MDSEEKAKEKEESQYVNDSKSPRMAKFQSNLKNRIPLVHSINKCHTLGFIKKHSNLKGGKSKRPLRMVENVSERDYSRQQYEAK